MSVAVRERELGQEECVQSGLERRNALITQYRPYVYKIARSVAVTLACRVNVDDLAGWGFLGLIEAAARYDASRGVSFRTFAHSRIRGAVLDGLRLEFGGLPALPVTWRDEDGEIDNAIELCADAGYEEHVFLGSIDHTRAFDSPDRHLWLVELRDRLEDALATLTPLERDLVEHRYVYDQPLQAFAAERRMSKSWFSRVHRRALQKMRSHLVRAARKRRAR